jgi:outer membrane lipoprotein-sorting protein
MLVVGDAQGGTSTFTFTNLKENTNPPDSTFAFKAPRGTDVIDRY